MDKVSCRIEEEERDNSKGRSVKGICATCTLCDHKTFSFGTGENSIKRCLATMREECPEGEKHYYIDEADEE